MREQSRIFGIGLSRTGTTSLAKALKQLGFKTVHYPHDPITYRELVRGQFRLTVLEEFRAVTDITVVPYYPQLDAAYPGSKFILTVRNLNSWLVSMRAHFEQLERHMDENPEFRPFTEFICAAVYGTLEFNENRMAYVYQTHRKNVESYFSGRASDFLVADLCGGQTWEEICRFLGCAEPSVPFPHLIAASSKAK